MSIRISIGHGGQTTVDVQGVVHAIEETASDLAEARAVRIVAAHAQALGRPVTAQVREAGREHLLRIYPDGRAERVAGATASDDASGVTAAEPGRRSVPASRPDPVVPIDDGIDVWSQDADGAWADGAVADGAGDRDAAERSAEQPTAPREIAPQPAQTPAPRSASSPSAAEMSEADAAWQAQAAAPARDGFRGLLASMGMAVRPSAEELARRREAFDADQQRNVQRSTDAPQSPTGDSPSPDEGGPDLSFAPPAPAPHDSQMPDISQTAGHPYDPRDKEHEPMQDPQRPAQPFPADDARARQQASAQEQREQERARRALIQTQYDGPRTILVANPKGGSRKTTSTYLLAAIMGIARGGFVVAWDANETMGTLGDRSLASINTRTSIDLLEESAERFGSVQSSRISEMDRYVRPQGDAHFDVLASDDTLIRQDIVDADGFETVHEILTRFYRMVLVDTGNNIRAGHFQAAVGAADQLVIPVTASRDSAKVALQMMHALTSTGHDELVRRAVVLLQDLEPRAAADEAYLRTVEEISAEFEKRAAAVVSVPFDPALKAGDRIDIVALAPATRAAYSEAAAAIAESLRSAMEPDSAPPSDVPDSAPASNVSGNERAATAPATQQASQDPAHSDAPAASAFAPDAAALDQTVPRMPKVAPQADAAAGDQLGADGSAVDELKTDRIPPAPGVDGREPRA